MLTSYIGIGVFYYKFIRFLSVKDKFGDFPVEERSWYVPVFGE